MKRGLIHVRVKERKDNVGRKRCMLWPCGRAGVHRKILLSTKRMTQLQLLEDAE